MSTTLVRVVIVIALLAVFGLTAIVEGKGVDPDAVESRTQLSSLSVLFLSSAVATFGGIVLHSAFPVHMKQHTKRLGWQRVLGEKLESKLVVFLAVVAIIVDLVCTAIATTALGGEELVEMAERCGFGCLIIFFVEQFLHLVSFGSTFFDHPWFVLDLLVVSVGAAVELNAELAAQYKWIGAVRLWKLAAFSFDVALVKHEGNELVERSHAACNHVPTESMCEKERSQST